MSDVRGKNEGAVDLSYKPPKSMKKLTSVDDEAIDAGFEWGALDSNPDIDVWAIRIPSGLNPSDLAGLTIKLPSGNSTGVTGTFKKGDSSYKLQSLEGEEAFGGEEMQNLSCLVPKRGDGGALYTIPRPLKHLILTREVPIPTPPISAPPPQPVRRPQPLDRLKHAFAPIGSEPISPPSSTMDVEQPTKTESPKKKQKKNPPTTAETRGAKKGKSKGKPTDKEPQPTEEFMDVDDAVEPLPIKKAKKKPSRADVKTEATEAAPSAKKEKKKRKVVEDQ
ncbi:unnamed protein product [Rhizoctonia solani]|uniref:DNA-directed RNA polymerase I subunit RPA34.5 n=1 Tax=Rhizoctonia solani TaxID=456999 RepID=A0A8H2WLY8_9AGAM|nr:unnamed protein product [Rhizoctonia solani]CAE6479235.1 unnamed protein product [Rhizoctonia solani]